MCLIRVFFIVSPMSQEIAGKASTRAVLNKAEAAVTTRYGCYVRYAEGGDGDEHYDSDSDGHRENASPDGINRGHSGPEAFGVNLGSTTARRFV